MSSTTKKAILLEVIAKDLTALGERRVADVIQLVKEGWIHFVGAEPRLTRTARVACAWGFWP